MLMTERNIVRHDKPRRQCRGGECCDDEVHSGEQLEDAQGRIDKFHRKILTERKVSIILMLGKLKY